MRSGTTALAINEVCSNNAGTWVDELGETDDFIELVNTSDMPLDLADFELGELGKELTRLPSQKLLPQERVIIWADATPSQGHLHVNFRVSSSGESLALRNRKEMVESRVQVPALAENEVWARFPDMQGDFQVCRYASAMQANGAACSPPLRPDLTDEVGFQAFNFPAPFPAPSSYLEVSELALRPATFIELVSTADELLPTGRFSLRIAPHKPGQPWPSATAGVEVWDGQTSLAPGERIVIPLSPTPPLALESDPLFEGVLTLFDRENLLAPVWRQDFMEWPLGAVLARDEATRSLRFCQTATPGKPNTACDPLPTRPIRGRLRNFWTPNDFRALAQGGTDVGIDSVKFVAEKQAPGLVHFLGSQAWELHYTFIREQIERAPHLNRCLPEERRQFNLAWYDFSVKNYFTVEGRDFLLGALDTFTSTGVNALDFTFGDQISAAQMFETYQVVVPKLAEPRAWSLHPQDSSQEARLLALDGQVPIVSKNAPFRGLTLQALNNAVGFGQLVYVPSAELQTTPLGSEWIVITDDVPNDLGLVGGLITEAFQTPLAHVNVLSQARGTPNLALANAHLDPRVAPWIGNLVRFEVGAGGFSITLASAAEAEAHWEATRNNRQMIVPILDVSRRGLVPLAGLGLSALPVIGAKAAQLAELTRVAAPTCGAPLRTPEAAFAIPVSHYLDHFKASGAETLLDTLISSPATLADPTLRWAQLAKIREAILSYPVNPALLEEVSRAVFERWGNARVRFRSSSNTEDLTGFSGAGLHTSTSIQLGDPTRGLALGMRTVWASLYRDRAFDERSLVSIDEHLAAMGILVHEGFLSEAANGVAVSRNILNPAASDARYINAQIGEASVTNPAPGVSTEELLFNTSGYSSEALHYLGRSSLTPNAVLGPVEAQQVACFIGAIETHFRPKLDPNTENPRFAMEMEFKFVGPARDLWIKQARPHHFGSTPDAGDCREY